MNPTMTISEIKSKFDSEWVLIEDPKLDDQLEVLEGKVIYHCKDRDQFDRESLKHPTKHSAIVYTGETPEGMEFAL